MIHQLWSPARNEHKMKAVYCLAWGGKGFIASQHCVESCGELMAFWKKESIVSQAVTLVDQPCPCSGATASSKGTL